MNLLYPRIRKGWLRSLLTTSVIGALIAGGYGIVHDQITFAISPEYFTKFKFNQFSYADPGMGDRSFVVVIGFLATWWVGFISGWFLWRLGVDKEGNGPRPGTIIRRFWWIVGCGVVCGIGGYFFGRYLVATGASDVWSHYFDQRGVIDHDAFFTVGQIHNFGYLGAALGLVIAGVIVWRGKGRRDPSG